MFLLPKYFIKIMITYLNYFYPDKLSNFLKDFDTHI